MFADRVLSGMRPTGRMHIGHYHGALKNWVRLQEQHECLFFAADWHALTTHYDEPEVIADTVWEMFIDWLSAGLDPARSTIFIQSRVPQHAELALLLGMFTPVAWLERVPTYKDQQQKLAGRDLSTYGFLGYPLMQGADILIYRANLVPVGEDQVSHLELARELARRFNHLYGREPGFEGARRVILPEPRALLTATPKVPGLDGQKMSKSYGNAIFMREDPAEVTKKVRTMQTDPARVRRTDPGNPEHCPVWPLHQIYSDAPTRDWVVQGCTTAGIGCLECKQPVIDAIIREQRPLIERAQRYVDDPQLVRNIVADGCDRARKLAEETMRNVREAMGLRYD